MKIVAGMPWRLDWQFTGLSKRTLQFFDEVGRQGGRVHLYCAGPKMTRASFSTHPVRIQRRSDGDPWSPLLNSVAFSSRFSERLERLKYDVLHCFNTTSLFVSKKPYLFQTLNPTYAYIREVLAREYPDEPKFRRLLRYYASVAQVERKEYEDAQVIVARSQEVKENIIGYHEVEPERIHVIPDGLSDAEITQPPAPRKHGKMKMILFSGSIRLIKGFTYLIDALETVVREVPEAVLVAAGQLSPVEREIILRKLKTSPAASKVIMAGFLPQDRYRTYLDLADVGCVPTMAADTSLSILEYVSLGIPVVTTHLCGFEEIDKVGIEVPPRDAEATASALIEALTNQDLRDKAIRNARKVLERHSWRVIVRDFMKLYEGVSR